MVHAYIPTRESITADEAVAWILAVVDNTEKPNLDQFELELPLAA